MDRLPRLVTHEDGKYYHVHKVLGMTAGAHYMYRALCYCASGSMGFAANYNTAAWIAVHFALSTTSFIFRIPRNRVRKAPMIWPEFRAHSVVFACRSLMAMVLALVVPANYFGLASSVNILMTIMAADWISRHYANDRAETTMRDMPYPECFSAATCNAFTLYYAFSQVCATTYILFSKDAQFPFVIMFPIQIAAFLMTCVRKGIIGPLGWHVGYAAALGINYVYGFWEPEPAVGSRVLRWSIIMAFCLLRFRFRINKYLLWTWAIAGRCLLVPQ